MSERTRLLARLRRILGLGDDGDSAPRPVEPPASEGLPPGCEEVETIPCEQAARRVYEYLDGELEEAEAEEIRCHVLQCERCYPMYEWERMFLEALSERGDRPEENPELRHRVAALLDRTAD